VLLAGNQQAYFVEVPYVDGLRLARWRRWLG